MTGIRLGRVYALRMTAPAAARSPASTTAWSNRERVSDPMSLLPAFLFVSAGAQRGCVAFLRVDLTLADPLTLVRTAGPGANAPPAIRLA